MKKVMFSLLVAAGLVFNLSSCEKDKGTPPNIAFITTTGYTSADATIAHGSSFVIGVNTSQAESGDVVKTLNLSLSTAGAADVTVRQTTIPDAQNSAYSQTDSLVAGAAGVTQRYTYTVTNRDGITNSVKLTVTPN